MLPPFLFFHFLELPTAILLPNYIWSELCSSHSFYQIHLHYYCHGHNGNKHLSFCSTVYVLTTLGDRLHIRDVETRSLEESVACQGHRLSLFSVTPERTYFRILFSRFKQEKTIPVEKVEKGQVLRVAIKNIT